MNHLQHPCLGELLIQSLDMVKHQPWRSLVSPVYRFVPLHRGDRRAKQLRPLEARAGLGAKQFLRYSQFDTLKKERKIDQNPSG